MIPIVVEIIVAIVPICVFACLVGFWLLARRCEANITQDMEASSDNLKTSANIRAEQRPQSLRLPKVDSENWPFPLTPGPPSDSGTRCQNSPPKHMKSTLFEPSVLQEGTPLPDRPSQKPIDIDTLQLPSVSYMRCQQNLQSRPSLCA